MKSSFKNEDQNADRPQDVNAIGSVPTTAADPKDQPPTTDEAAITDLQDLLPGSPVVGLRDSLTSEEKEERNRIIQEVRRDVDTHLQESQKKRTDGFSCLMKKAERDLDNAKPFLERELWRRRTMYRGWALEAELCAPTDRSVITRSHYGYEVLNTPDLGVVDVDFNYDYNIDAQLCESLSRLKSWSAEHTEQSFRAYRTSKGLRYLRTDAPMQLDAEFDALCESVAADEVYRYMCREEQSCFRARISPKPYRIKVDWPGWSPYAGWLEPEPNAETVRKYEAAAKGFRTCEFLGTIGNGMIDETLRPLVELHDRKCRVEEIDLKLEKPLLDETVVRIRSINAVIFNRKYRPQGMAPQTLWWALDSEVRRRLREVEDMDSIAFVMKEHDRCTGIEKKWEGKFKRFVFDFVTPKKNFKSYAEYKSWASMVDGKELEAYWASLPDADLERLTQEIEDDDEFKRGDLEDWISKMANGTLDRRRVPERIWTWRNDGPSYLPSS